MFCTGLMFTNVMSSCQHRLKDTTNASLVDDVAQQMYGENHQVVKNNTEDFALIFQQIKVRPTQVFSQVDFSVYDVSRDTVIYQSRVSNGSVGWHNDHQIFFESIPGRAETKRSRKLFDVKAQKISSLDK